MADYLGAWRSNRFRVHYLPTFEAWIQRVRGVEHRTSFDDQGLAYVTLFQESGYDTGELPDQIEMTEAEIEESLAAQKERGLDPAIYGDDWIMEGYDFLDGLLPHIAKGAVCFLMGSGSEKLRYIGGWAYALRNPAFHGQSEIFLSLDQIYDSAEQIFGVEVGLDDRASF